MKEGYLAHTCLVQVLMGLILKAAQILHISLYAWDSVFSFFSNLNGYRFTLTHVKPSSLFYFLSKVVIDGLKYDLVTAQSYLHSCVLSCSVASNSCDPADCSPPGSSVHGISQARILEWVAISFSRGSSWPRDQTQVYCIAGSFFTNWASRVLE